VVQSSPRRKAHHDTAVEEPAGPSGETQSADVEAFRAAWEEFASACHDTVAPEATYQAWLAHFVIGRTALLRVVREVDFGAKHLLPDDTERFRGYSLMVDITVLREPLVHLPRRAGLRVGPVPDGTPGPESGLQRLAEFSLVSELKVASSQIGGLKPASVLRDAQKLSALLNAAERDYPASPVPAAFVCVLNNHPTRRIDVEALRDRAGALGIRPDLQLLVYTPAQSEVPTSTMSPTQLQVRVLDSPEKAAARRRGLRIDRQRARLLGEEAVRYIEQGWYPAPDGRSVSWSAAVKHAVDSKVSIPPDTELPTPAPASHPVTVVEIANETTLAAARRLVEAGMRPLVLNFANGIHPGGGFLHGARAQEESLCRSSALYATLVGDPMYAAHARRSIPDSTDWAILSPDVPVFRHDDGRPLDEPWLASFITCAAPYAPALGQPASGDLLDGSAGCFRSPTPTATPAWCSAPGDAAPSATTRTGPHATSGATSRTTAVPLSTSCSRSPTGPGSVGPLDRLWIPSRLEEPPSGSARKADLRHEHVHEHAQAAARLTHRGVRGQGRSDGPSAVTACSSAVWRLRGVRSPHLRISVEASHGGLGRTRVSQHYGPCVPRHPLHGYK
jgi:hypothetical protein